MLRFNAIAIAAAAFIIAAGGAQAQRRFDNVQIKTHKAAGNVYMLEGQGGNIGVSAGPDGILIIDDQYGPLAPKIRAAFEKLASGKLEFVLNTHWHGDHTGGNPVFGREGTIIAHTNVLRRLDGSAPSGRTQNPPMAKEGLPVITFDETLSVRFNGEQIKLVHFPHGHTDGDAIVFFTGSNVVHMGDHFFNGAFPFIDTASGGSVDGFTRNVGEAIGLIPEGAAIIPGHGPLAKIEDLKSFHAMLLETTETVRKAMAGGKTAEEIKADGLGAKYESWGRGFVNAGRWIDTIHASLSK